MNPSKKCAGCRSPLLKKEYLQCFTCKAKYDLECAHVSNRSLSQLDRKDQWKCPECTSKLPKKGNINTPVRSTASASEEVPVELPKPSLSPQDIRNSHNNVTLRTKHTRTLIEKSSPHLDNSENSGSTCNNTLDDLKSYIGELFSGHLDSLREAIIDLTNSIKAQNSRMEQIEARLNVLENKSEEARRVDISELESTIQQLQSDIVERDQALLVNDVEITGCPETASENCTHIVLMVAKKIGVELDEKDIVSAGRAGPVRPGVDGGAPAKPRPLAVRLARRASRDSLLQAARTRRDLNTEGLKLPGGTRPLYINERLSKFNRMIFQKARNLARDNNYKYVWTREGKIFLRQEQGKPRLRVRNETDLLKVFGKKSV